MNATTMHRVNPRNERFLDLVGDLQTDIKSLIKKEVELAKTEMGEKLGSMGRNAGFAAAGGILALIAVFMLLLGIGAILSQLLQRTGLSAGAAYFISYGGLSLILAGVGYALIRKAMHAFSKISLSPDKALAGAKGAEPVPVKIRKMTENGKPRKMSSDELQTEVIATRTRMDVEMSELKSRLTPGYMIKSFLAGMKHHPTQALIVGAGTGLGGYLVWRNRHLAALKRAQAARKWYQWKFFRQG
jgi:hypothetical protein